MRDQPLQPRRDDRSRAVVERRAARNDKRCGRVASWPARWWRQGGIPAVADRSGQSASGVERPRHRERSAAIFAFYASLVGDVPYPSFTLALSESDLPGGHSPAYFAILNQPLPTTPYVWRNDPVSFNGYPTFFLAHELGHQWWGQAVGWKNYHEQWLSEGIAQYFAAMYAEQERGNERSTTCCVRCAAGRSRRRRRVRSISATGSATSRATAGCSAPSSTTRPRWCCTCCGA